MEQENKKNNKKIIIIGGAVLVVIIAIIVGIVILNKDDNSGNEATSEETGNVDEYTALESDIEQAIVEKNLIKASGYYAVLKFSVDNGGKVDNGRYAKITNDLQALKDERKTELLTKVDADYDDMTQETTYNPKGFNEYQEQYVNEAFDSGEKVIFQPCISAKDNANFYLIFTLLRDGWIFFDSMIFNVDGEITNISSNNFEKTTQVIGGGMVGEVAGMYLLKYPMFNALVESIINSNETKIRLVGTNANGNVDFVLTQEEKDNLKIMYELSLCF